MKITKILLVALTLMLFSCSQEEDVNVASQFESNLKNNGLTQREVYDLTAECLAFSISTEFIDMRTKSQAFANMMNYHIDKTWTSRSDVENWLNSNTYQTKFASKQEGLDMYDDLVSLTGVFLAENEHFFISLGQATEEQAHIILKPILLDPPPIQANSACEDACYDDFEFYCGWSDYSYEVAVSNAGGDAGYIAFMEWSYVTWICDAVEELDSCTEGCE